MISRRTFLQNTLTIAAAAPLAFPISINAADPVPFGLQPSMLCTKAGTLIVQSQLSTKPHPQPRIFYPYALSTVISRDGGTTWTEFPLQPGDNGVNIEGGIIQLRDGTILALETYV